MENLYNIVSNINSIVNSYVWGTPMLMLIFFTGIFYTIRLRAFQITHIKEVFDNTIKGIFKSSKNSNNKNVLSQFQALSTALAATIGTGNIAGVATAIVLGGPGSIFWMWVCAIFSMATHFAEIVLGIYYRRKNKDKSFSGGAMYYLEYGMGNKKNFKSVGKILAILFAIFTFIASFGIGNMTQVNSISEVLNTAFKVKPLYCGIVLAILVSMIILSNIQTLGRVTEKIVPFMSVFYILIGLIVVILNFRNIPIAFYNIFTGAFNSTAIAGGVFGYVIKRAINFGFKRGIFSNEAGLGSSVMAHSTSNEKEPIKQGMWGVFEVFFDTIVVCTFTSLIILTSSYNADNLNNALNNLTTNETYAILDNSSSFEKNKSSLIVDTKYKTIPIKLDNFGNAKLYSIIPSSEDDYVEVNAYGKTYYAIKNHKNELKDGDFTFSNIVKLYAIPLTTQNKEIVFDNYGNIALDSIHIENVSGASLVTLAVSSKLSNTAGKILAIAITLFAFSTVLGWSLYGTKAVEYLGGKFATYVYRIAFIIFIIIGTTIKLNLAWDISDTLNGLMALPNLIGLLFLSGDVIKIKNNFYKRETNKKLKPMLSFFDENKSNNKLVGKTKNKATSKNKISKRKK